MHRSRLALAAILSLPFATASASAQEAPSVHWRARTFSADAAPHELPSRCREAVERWSGWAARLGYRMDLDSRNRVLLLSPEDLPRRDRGAELLEELVRGFDERFPVQGPRRVADADVSLAGAAAARRRDAPAVVARLRERAHLVDLLAELSGEPEVDATWITRTRGASGFELEESGLSAWLLEPEGERDWSADHELVHRVTRTLLTIRFGPQPTWLNQGASWTAELEHLGSIRGLVERTGYEGMRTRRGWEAALKREFGSRNAPSFDLEELQDARAGYDEERAARSWGLVAFLTDHRHGSLGALAAELGAYHAAYAPRERERRGALRWEIPLTAQREAVERHAGPEVWSELERYFAQGRRYEPAQGG